MKTRIKFFAAALTKTFRRFYLLLMLLLLTLPAVVQAQFYYTSDNGAITITGYTGHRISRNGPAAERSFLPSFPAVTLNQTL